MFGWTFICGSFCALPESSPPRKRQSPPSINTRWRLSTARSQGSDTGDTLIGSESDQLILGGTAADSIGSQYSNSCLVGSDGNDSFFVNSTVLGVGAGTR